MRNGRLLPDGSPDDVINGSARPLALRRVRRREPAERRTRASRSTAFSAVKVLAIDGGGIRGLIPALVLAEIERRTEPPDGRRWST